MIADPVYPTVKEIVEIRMTPLVIANHRAAVGYGLFYSQFTEGRARRGLNSAANYAYTVKDRHCAELAHP
jgi:hypothetical protein